MDLYPEAFVAGGLIGRRNILYKFYTHIIGSTSPDLLICLGQNQSAFIKSTRGYQCPEIIYPVGIEMPDFEEQSQTKARFKKDVSKLYIAYCGNLGEAHDISFLEHLILGLNSEKYVFVISAYGNYKEILRSKVSGLGYVCFCDQLNQTEMKLIDLQLVSLKREWTHISVPSRALSALKLGHHIVYFGSKESDTWQYISKVAFGADNLEDMLGYLDSFNPDDLHYLSLQSAFLTKEIEALLERARILLSNSILDICNS